MTSRYDGRGAFSTRTAVEKLHALLSSRNNDREPPFPPRRARPCVKMHV